MYVNYCRAGFAGCMQMDLFLLRRFPHGQNLNRDATHSRSLSSSQLQAPAKCHSTVRQLKKIYIFKKTSLKRKAS